MYKRDKEEGDLLASALHFMRPELVAHDGLVGDTDQNSILWVGALWIAPVVFHIGMYVRPSLPIADRNVGHACVLARDKPVVGGRVVLLR